MFKNKGFIATLSLVGIALLVAFILNFTSNTTDVIEGKAGNSVKASEMKQENEQNSDEKEEVELEIIDVEKEEPVVETEIKTITHKVKSGETLSKIAQQYGATLDDLLSWNKQIKNPNLIYVGDFIIIKQVKDIASNSAVQTALNEQEETETKEKNNSSSVEKKEKDLSSSNEVSYSTPTVSNASKETEKEVGKKESVVTKSESNKENTVKESVTTPSPVKKEEVVTPPVKKEESNTQEQEPVYKEVIVDTPIGKAIQFEIVNE